MGEEGGSPEMTRADLAWTRISAPQLVDGEMGIRQEGGERAVTVTHPSVVQCSAAIRSTPLHPPVLV